MEKRFNMNLLVNQNPLQDIIIFECSDIKNDIGLMITTTIKNTNTNNDDNEFKLHLYDGYNDIALVMNMNIRDFAKMFDSLSEYFQRDQIEL